MRKWKENNFEGKKKWEKGECFNVGEKKDCHIESYEGVKKKRNEPHTHMNKINK